MDTEIQQFVRVNCRLSVPRLNHLINFINEWSRASLHYDNEVIENRVYYWVPGSVGVEVAGGDFGGGAGGFGGNNQQGLGGNDHQAVQGEAVEFSASKEGGAVEVSGSKEGSEAAVAVDEDHEAGHDHQSKRNRMREHQKEKKIQKV